MSNELKLEFDMCLRTNETGQKAIALDGSELERSDPDLKTKAVFVPVLRRVFQNPGKPVPDLPQDPMDDNKWDKVPKASLSDEGWRDPNDSNNLYPVDVDPGEHWPDSKFPNDVLYNADPSDSRIKK